MLPLHKEAQGAQKAASSHAGLWYDRFFNQYDHDCKVGDDGKTSWIKKTVASSIGDDKKLKSFAKRQQALLEACGGQSLVMRADWHFVTGLGNNHPVENGFAWHHTLGVPYLTGAAVKGMVRAWCEVWVKGFDEEKIKQWFGDTEQSGELIFFDAVPTVPVKLKADIMTPHYGDWYAKGDEPPKRDGSNVPADWHDPVPIPFLVVDKGASFQFAVAKRAGSKIDLSEVIGALSDALQWLGAGAKTAVGYGRFSEDQQAKTKREKQMREKQRQKEEKLKDQQIHARAQSDGLTGVALDAFIFIEKLEGVSVSDRKKIWLQEGELLLERLQDCDNPDEKTKAVSIMLEQCERFDPGIVADPDKRKGKKQKPAYKENAIKMVKSLLALSKG